MSQRRMSAQANGRAGGTDTGFKKAVTPQRAQGLFLTAPGETEPVPFGLPAISESKGSMTPAGTSLRVDPPAPFDPLGLLGGGPSSPVRTAASPFSPTNQGSSGNTLAPFGSPGKHVRRATATGATGVGAALPFTAPGFPAWDEQFRGPLSSQTVEALGKAFVKKASDPANPLSPKYKNRDPFPWDFSVAASAGPPSAPATPAASSAAANYDDDFLSQFDFSGTPKPVAAAAAAPASSSALGGVGSQKSLKLKEAGTSTPSSGKKLREAGSTPKAASGGGSTPKSGGSTPKAAAAAGGSGTPKAAETPKTKSGSKSTLAPQEEESEGSDSDSSEGEEGQVKKKSSKKKSKKDDGKTEEERKKERAKHREDVLKRRQEERRREEIEEMKLNMVRQGEAAEQDRLGVRGAASVAGPTAVAAAAAAGPAHLTPPEEAAPRRRPTGTDMKIEALTVMKRGTPFLKYGKSGFPHFRLFLLSENQEYIAWFSKGKKMRDTIVKLSDVESLRIGQTTPTFSRHPAPELASSSFSLLYKDGIRTLDLIAKDPNEFSIWTQGLRSLLLKMKGGVGPGTVKSLVVDVDVQPHKTSTNDLVDAVTGETAAQKDEKMGIVRVKKATNTGDKRMYREVAKQFTDLKKKVLKIKDTLTGNKFYTNANFNTMNVICKKLEEYVTRISLLFTDGEYEECDDEIWRANVELEGLQNLMKSSS